MSSEKLSVVVIGSGPAGWTAALYLARAGLEPLVFEGELDGNKMLPGGQLMTTTEVENYPGFPNGGISGPDMMILFQRQAEEFGAKPVSETILSLDRSEDGFTLKSRQATYQAKTVILATGATAKYLGLPAEEQFMNRGVSACATCDGALPRFRKKPIVVVGGGDTAAEEALFLARFGSIVYLIHRRDQLRASPIMAQRVIDHEKIQIVWDTVVDNLIGDDQNGVTGVALKNVKTEEKSIIDCVGFFVAIGHQPNSSLVKDLVDLDPTGYVVTEGKTTHTKCPGLFACGDVQDSIYRQAVTAAGSGCSAAIDCTRYLETLE